MKPFVFIDRDGTLIAERNYLADPGGVELIEGAAEALRRLRDAGFGLAIVTNQSGVARGYFDLARVDAIHERIRELLSAGGAALDAIYVCPHRPEDGCACRKPRPGLIEAAARELGADLTASFLIGDKASDLDCGRNAGVTPILVRTGYGRALEAGIGASAAFVADSLYGAVDWILARHSASSISRLSSNE